MKPISATEALKAAGFHLRYSRAEAPKPQNVSGSAGSGLSVPIIRERSSSTKRKASAELNDGTQKKTNTEICPSVLPPALDKMERKICALRGICSKINEDAAKLKVDIGLENIIRALCEFVDTSASLHEDMVKTCTIAVDAPVPIPDPDPEPEQVLSQEVFAPSYSQAAARKPNKVFAPKPAAAKNTDPKRKAFEDAVDHAERSTLIFNLNLGTKKTLNEKVILSQATVALSAAAATVEGNQGKPPSKEAIAALDDVMSVTKEVTLFGKVTKPYENKANPQDPRNKTFFTLPVRYEFKDRETRVEAETILRDTCKIDCTTPYPTILRHCIKEVIRHFRSEYLDDYIRVTVDAAKMSLKVCRRVKGDGWYVHDDLIRLPEQVLDIHARYVPEDLVMPELPVRSREAGTVEPMVESETELATGSGLES
jgi:hypothetical protein